jgi:hypothetical protein
LSAGSGKSSGVRDLAVYFLGPSKDDEYVDASPEVEAKASNGFATAATTAPEYGFEDEGDDYDDDEGAEQPAAAEDQEAEAVTVGKQSGVADGDNAGAADPAGDGEFDYFGEMYGDDDLAQFFLT